VGLAVFDLAFLFWAFGFHVLKMYGNAIEGLSY